MTQPSIGTEAVDAQAGVDEAVSAPGAPALEAQESIDLREMAEHLRPAPAPQATVTDDADGADDDDGAPEAEAPGTPEGQPKQQLTVEQWAEVLKDAPHRINEIPGKMRGETLRHIREADARSVDTRIAEAYAAGRAAEQRVATLAAQVAEVDELRDTDPKAFVDWQTQFPDRHANYVRFKAELEAAETGGQTQQQVVAMVQERASAVVQQLRGYPEVADKLKDRNYPMTIEGVTRLAADVAVEIARHDAAPARQRQQAAAEQAARPKALITGGGAAGELTAAALKAMSPEQIVELRRTPDGAARIERAVAAARK